MIDYMISYAITKSLILQKQVKKWMLWMLRRSKMNQEDTIDTEDPFCRIYWQVNHVARFLFHHCWSEIEIKDKWIDFCFHYQVFVALTINAGFLAIGGNIALTGIVLSKLRDSSKDIQMTTDEESWFGKVTNWYYIILTMKKILILGF